jgi:Fe-S-cluster-containing hydrogenase component 2
MPVTHEKDKCYGKDHCQSVTTNYCMNACPYNAIGGNGQHLNFTLSQCNGPCRDKYGKEEKRPCETACLNVHITHQGEHIKAIHVT